MCTKLQLYVDAKITEYRRIQDEVGFDQLKSMIDEERWDEFYQLAERVVEPELHNNLDTNDPEVSKFIDRLGTGELSELSFIKSHGPVGNVAELLAQTLDEVGY